MKVCATVVISVIVGVLLGFYAPHSTAPSRSQSHASRRLVESSADVAEALAEVDLLVATDTALTSAAVSALAAAPNYAEINRPDWEKFMAYLDEIQNPPSCAGVHLVAIMDRGGVGIGALLSHLHQTAITLLAQGHAVAFFASNATSRLAYVNPALCPEEDWTCFYRPLSKCTHHPEAIITVRDRWPCAKYDPKALQARAGLARPHARLFYEAAVAAFIMRPNARLGNAERAMREEIRLPLANDAHHLSLYIRHGDSSIDGRPWIPLEQYAAMAEVVEFWDMPGVATIFLGSDDRRALADVKRHFSHTSALSGARITHIPDKYFVRLLPGAAARHIHGGVNPADDANTAAEAAGWDEGTVLLVQLHIFASTRGFIGTLSANMNKMAFLLASARHYGDRPQGIWDAAGDTFFGCHDRMSFPKGDWAEYAAKHRDEWLEAECAEKPQQMWEQGLQKECTRLGVERR